MLEECGHYAQNLALRIAYEKLRGYECGGVMDKDMKRLLGLDGTDAYILLAMLCGKGPKKEKSAATKALSAGALPRWDI